MGTIISVSIEKGGNSKTTTVVNLAAIMAQAGKKVLVVDVDGQGNCTYTLTGKKRDDPALHGKGLYDMFRVYGYVPPKSFIMPSAVPGVDIIPTTSQTKNIPTVLKLLYEQEQDDPTKNRSDCLEKDEFFAAALSEISAGYDYVLFDTPPADNPLITMALVAADYVLMPIKCDQYSLDGVLNTWNQIQEVNREYDAGVQVIGILLTCTTKANIVSYIRESLSEHEMFGNLLFHTEIRNSVAVSESTVYGQPVVLSNHRSLPAQDYCQLWDELQTRLKDREAN